MANVVLKDKNGNPVTYSGVKEVGLPQEDGTTTSFIDASTLYCYYAAPNGDDLIIKLQGNILVYANGPCGVTAILNDAALQDYGGNNAAAVRTLYLVFTTKKLTVGSTYSFDYVLGD